MEDIFLMCRPFDMTRPPSKTHAPYLLTHVCRAWYGMVADLPGMWSTIILTTGSESTTLPAELVHIAPSRLEAGARHLAMCINRSGTMLLSIFVRADFIAHPASSDYFQYIHRRISRLCITFPFLRSEEPPAYLSSSLWNTMPNLHNLEVRAYHPIHDSDQICLDYITTSVQTLRGYILERGPPTIFSQPIIQNMSNLENLTITELLPVPLCFFILRNAATLRKLSIALAMLPDDVEGVQDEQLTSILASQDFIQPFVHPRLQYLALAHFRYDSSIFFEYATLPQLQFLSLEFRVRSEQGVWPHDALMSFFRRSRCKIKYFEIVEQPITPSQLLQLLHLPNMMGSLEYLGIQNDTEPNLDDDVLEQLTLRPSASQKEVIPISIPGSTVDQTKELPLCPNIERLLLLVSLEDFSLPKLIAMFNSRLRSDATSVLSHKPLRHVEMDLYDEMEVHLEALHQKGLVLTLFEPLGMCPYPPDAEQQRQWGHHLSEGLHDELYDRVTGTWRASHLTLIDDLVDFDNLEWRIP